MKLPSNYRQQLSVRLDILSKYYNVSNLIEKLNSAVTDKQLLKINSGIVRMESYLRGWKRFKSSTQKRADMQGNKIISVV